ncbi:SDR family oxidoreductase [Halobacteriovorax sp. HLS]|uniref:dTDP-4-dehydrorhamnose reductase family protein n=1 Tax=Halobacteriovorax sp. HLS TaxID=2234000 RepID=UPI0013E3BD93|nr:SDR family oxidoreductase [Halobacteriovorax sp. HLS]
MRILVIGGAGMLGHRVWITLAEKYEVYGTIRSEFNENLKSFSKIDPSKVISNVNILDDASIDSAFAKSRPDLVINCVGILKVDPSLDNKISSIEINSLFPHKLAKKCKSYNSRLIHFSTDCVFDGVEGSYDEDSLSFSNDLYGLSKRMGELKDQQHCLTIRTSIIGREINPRGSLVEWFINDSEKNVTGYKNAIFSGYPTQTISRIIKDYVIEDTSLSGIYHISNDPIDKYSLLVAIKEKFDLDKSIEPDYDFKINRSLCSEKFRAQTNCHIFTTAELMDDLSVDWDIYNTIAEERR